MEEILLNIVITPPKKIGDKLIELSQSIDKEVETEFTLNYKNALPHLTLYQAKYPQTNLELIKQTLKEVASNLAKLEVILDSFSTPLGYVYLDARKTDDLFQFHKQIVDKLNPLREGLMFTEHLSLPGITPTQRDSVYKYGHLLVMNEFWPHVTLSKPKHLADIDKVKQVLPSKVSYTFEVDALHLAAFGPFGTCPEILETFSQLG